MATQDGIGQTPPVADGGPQIFNRRWIVAFLHVRLAGAPDAWGSGPLPLPLPQGLLNAPAYNDRAARLTYFYPRIDAALYAERWYAERPDDGDEGGPWGLDPAGCTVWAAEIVKIRPWREEAQNLQAVLILHIEAQSPTLPDLIHTIRDLPPQGIRRAVAGRPAPRGVIANDSGLHRQLCDAGFGAADGRYRTR